MLTRLYHRRQHKIYFENCHIYSHNTAVYCVHVGVFRYYFIPLSVDKLPLNNIVKMVFAAFSFGTLFLFKNMILSTVSLYNLFLCLLISRPSAEKKRSDGTDVAWTARRQ